MKAILLLLSLLGLSSNEALAKRVATYKEVMDDAQWFAIGIGNKGRNQMGAPCKFTAYRDFENEIEVLKLDLALPASGSHFVQTVPSNWVGLVDETKAADGSFTRKYEGLTDAIVFLALEYQKSKFVRVWVGSAPPQGPGAQDCGVNLP